jgi:hypothetical protein
MNNPLYKRAHTNRRCRNTLGGLLDTCHEGDPALRQQFVERSKKQHALFFIISVHISFLSSETQICIFHMT